jgi:hypothetical protein
MGKTVNLVDIDGVSRAVPEEEVQYRLDRGWRAETAQDVAARTTEDAKENMYGGIGGTASAVAGGVLRGATLGLSDAAIAATGGEDDRRRLAELRERHQVASIGGEAIGSLAGGRLPAGLATRAGARVARTAEGAGAATKIGRAAAGGATEGAIAGAGQGVSEFALSDDHSIENLAAALKSNVLFGAGAGGALGGATKGVEVGLRRAKTALDKVGKRSLEAGADTGDDLTKLDRKGLQAAERVELDAIEAARVPRRAELADEIKAFRREVKEQKVWLATKGAEEAEIRSIGKRAFKADKALDNLLDDPKALAESPKAALRQLRIQEAALDDLVTKHGDNLRAKFAGDASGDRLKALEGATGALERNRALQAKISEVTGAPTSPRLDAIQDAAHGLSAATKREGATIGDSLMQAGMGHMLGAATGVPFLGEAVLAAKAVGGVWKKLGGDTAAAADRTSKAIGTFLDVTSKVPPAARLAASRTLANVSYGALADEKPTKKRKESLPDLYKARSREIRELTAPGPDGKPMMRLEARQKIAERLAPLRAANPIAYDRIETNKARAIEFLAEKLPRKPDLPGMGLGADTWQPSDMEMRGWARYVAAVEDPHGVVERLASGEVTPEDAEAMKAVYPEMYQQIQMEIMSKLGELRAKLPYQRRLALSIFSGVPVDPSLDPRVLAALQRTFASEPGTEGGSQAPTASPQFGSVTKPSPTAAQERGG